MTEAEMIKALKAAMSRSVEAAFTGGTCSNAPAPTALTWETVAGWTKLARQFRRTDITFEVMVGHAGASLAYDTAADGRVFECSPSQAQAIHEQWPLKLLKVLDEGRAQFAPISAGEWAPKYLPMPPYDLPPADQDHT